ncbi:MAG: hypothetical protein ACRDOB_29570 [Streptosporangiaceae bacterium]
MYKAHAKHLLAIAFVIYVVAAIITAVLALAGGTIGILLGSFVSVVAAFLLQATLVKAVQDVRDGRADLSIKETVSEATPYIWSVALASILAGIAITIGLLLIIAPGLYLITIWAVIIPVIVIERSGVMASFGRSHDLVRGHGWHVFGTLVIVYIIMLVVNIVLGAIFSALPNVLGDGLSSVISGTIISPFLAVVVTLVYYRLTTGAAVQPAGGDPWGGFQQSPQDPQNYGGYGQPPQDGGYGQPPQGGGYGQPPQGGGYNQPPQGGGYNQPPQGGGYNQPPQGGGYNQPPQGGGWNQPPQNTPNYPGGNQPPQGGGYNQPPQGGGSYDAFNQPTIRRDNLGGYNQPPQNTPGFGPGGNQPPPGGGYNQPPQDDQDADEYNQPPRDGQR